MLGVYTNFPEKVQKVIDFATSTSEKRLQKAIVEAFCKLNNTTLMLEEIAIPSVPECTVIFEFGVAEDNDFNYLDDEERARLLKIVEKKALQTMDFLCVLRYYRMQNERKRPLKFDYYMFRFAFAKEMMQMRVFHEKGLMYVSLKDLPEFVADRINQEFPRKVLDAFET